MAFTPISAGSWPSATAQTSSPITLGPYTPSNVGNLLVFQFGCASLVGSSPVVASITDGHNTWPAALRATLSAGNGTTEIWGINTTSTAGLTFSIAITGSFQTGVCSISEWSGNAATLTTDGTNGATSTATASPAPVITTTVNGDLVVSVAFNTGANTSNPASWTAFTTSGSTTVLGARFIQSTAGTINNVSTPNDIFTNGAVNANWSQSIVAFKPGATATGTFGHTQVQGQAINRAANF